MLIQVEADVYYAVHIEGEGEPIVLIHGFTGSAATWQDTIAELKQSYQVIAIDMLGHGQSSAPAELSHYTMSSVVTHLRQLFSVLQLESIRLVGYSMGGRIALAFTATYPKMVRALVLESASPGLKTVEEQLDRQQSDNALAQKIEQNGLSWFAEFWGNIPLFATQKRLAQEKQEQLKQARLNNSVLGLSSSLRGMGTGMQCSYWDKLAMLAMPVTLIVGQDDEKYVKIAREMQQHLPQATLVEVEQAGHNIHLEQTEQYLMYLIQEIKTDIRKVFLW